MTTGFVENLQTLSSLRGELAVKKKQMQDQLATTIEKKEKQINYLKLISEALLSCCSEVSKEPEEAKKELASLLEDRADGPSNVQQDVVMLYSLLDGSTGVEPVVALREKMHKMFFQSLTEKLTAASIGFAEVEKIKSIGGMSFNVFCNQPKKAKKLTPHQNNSLIISHLVYRMKQHMGTAAIAAKSTSAIAAQRSNVMASTS